MLGLGLGLALRLVIVLVLVFVVNIMCEITGREVLLALYLYTPQWATLRASQVCSPLWRMREQV